MPALSFSVFKNKIISGEKAQTIRRVRKYPIRPGDRLTLYWKQRTPEIQKLGEARCVEVLSIKIFRNCYILNELTTIDDPEELLQFATEDGFCSWEDLTNYFGSDSRQTCLLNNHSLFEGVLIKWGELAQRMQ